MARKLEDVLEECLIHLATGEMTVEECLARYPQHAADLRRMLPLSEALTEGRQIRPSAAFKQRNERDLLAQITAVSLQSPVSQQRNWLEWLAGYFTPLYRPAYVVAFIALLFLTAATTVAQAALPGDALYGWKLNSERAWRAVHPNPLNADLLLADRRANELAQVVGQPDAEAQGRQAYRHALEQLAHYTDSESQQPILAALARQQEMLAQAGIIVPQLEQFINQLSPPPVPVEATPTPPAAAEPVTDPALPTPIAPDQIVPMEMTPVLPEMTSIPDLLPPLLATPTPLGTP